MIRDRAARPAAPSWLLVAALGCAGGANGAGATDGGGAAGKPQIAIETTLGTLVVTLEPEAMPVTTANFLAYVDSGFYDGTLVHRVVDDWVIQGGGFVSGLVPKAPRAPIPLETSPRVKHVHGAISMARDPTRPDSATSQWFICDFPKAGAPRQPAELDGRFAAFGVLTSGFDVLEAITKVPTATINGLENAPRTEIVVRSARRR